MMKNWENNGTEEIGLVTQGSTLTVVRLGIPSSFCFRTTWTSAYGCPLVKLRKLINYIILDRIFISDWVNRNLCSESINTFDLQCTRSCKFYLFHLCSKENKEWSTGYTRPFYMADLLLMVSLEGVLLVDYMMSCQISQCGDRVASSADGHTVWMICQRKMISMNWLISGCAMVLWTNRTVELQKLTRNLS